MLKGGKDQTRLFFVAKLAEDMLGVNHPAVALTEGCMHPDLLANSMSKTAIKAVSDLALIVGVKEATTATTRGLLRPLLEMPSFLEPNILHRKLDPRVEL